MNFYTNIMQKSKKNGRYGYLVCCCGCGCELFRTTSQFSKNPDINYCRPCAAKNGTIAAAKVNKKHKQDDSFFSKSTLESYYWAGFIAADGCIYSNKKGEPNTLSIKIKETDSILLERFLKDTQSDNNILKSGNEDRKRVVISNTVWVKTLRNKFNIHPVKSLTHIPPDIQNWSKSQVKSFIVGYLDGDGTICFCGKYKHLKMGLVGTFSFLNFVKDFITSEYDVKLTEKCIQKKKNSPIYELSIYCSNAKKIIMDLKHLPIKKLDRKWCKVS